MFPAPCSTTLCTVVALGKGPDVVPYSQGPAMPPNSFLGRALMDPATGLPNIPYFSLIRDWEDQRAQRRKYAVRVVKIWVEGGSDRIRRALSWHLCQEMRSSDLIASDGRAHYRILLT